MSMVVIDANDPTACPRCGCKVKFMYFDEATKFCEMSTVDLTITAYDKSTVEILEKILAFSEYMNFKIIYDRGSTFFGSTN